MSQLIILCGIPGSGKSTWTSKNLKNGYWVSRDKIRYALLNPGEDYFSRENDVFNNFVHIIVEHLKNNEDVIADATHINKAGRLKLINAINRCIDDNNYEKSCIVFDTPLKECLRRNATRSGVERVPDNVIRRMFYQTSRPEADGINYNSITYIKE